MNEQIPQIPNETPQPNKLGKHFILLLAILIFALVGVGLVFAINYLSKDIENQKVEIYSDNQVSTEYFMVPELGIRFKITDDLKDLLYVINSNGIYGKNASFSTRSLVAMGGVDCAPESSPLGKINVNSKPRKTTGELDESKPDGFYFEYIHPQSGCTENKDGQELTFKQIDALKKASQTIEQIPISDWKTYRNEEYGFEFKYPREWHYKIIQTGGNRKLAIHLAPEELELNGGGAVEILVAEDTIDNYKNWLLSSEPTLVGERDVTLPTFEAKKITLRNSINRFESDFLIAERDSFVYVISGNEHVPSSESDANTFNGNYDKYEYKEVYEKILLTFKFIEFQNRQEMVPVINSISPQSGKIGTVVTLNGKNLAGFESDMDAWIEGMDGEVAYLPSYTYDYTQSEKITVQITGKVCKTNNSYSGLPCEEYMTIVPGIYKIYTTPWGVTSNKVQFEVLK